MRVPRDQMERYSDDVNAIADAAAEAAMAAYDEMLRRYPLEPVADVREGLIAVVESVATSYGAAAGELAAELYDALAVGAGAGVPEALVPDIGETALEVIDRKVRYYVDALVPEREDI